MTSDARTPEPFREFFRRATSLAAPYPYQQRLALAEPFPQLLDIPTGLGKTAAVILAWVWRRRFADKQSRVLTPRRLVYCLPMRVLVEQTFDNARGWLNNLGMLATEPGGHDHSNTTHWNEWAPGNDLDISRIAVSLLMGGEEPTDWALWPERDAILVGTQDMLLSRALNRGYAASRFRWPLEFGLLNNDCLWMFDEIQLMGSGLATTAQLHAFRHALGCFGPNQSLWASATLDPQWLQTPDLNLPRDLAHGVSLGPEDHGIPAVIQRYCARKRVRPATARIGDIRDFATELLTAHRPATRTLAILNTVGRASALYLALKRAQPSADLILLHSRFRPADRKNAVAELLRDPAQAGTIIISTQIVEAGVDVSATTLFTELAPWPSLVQRFGRCNRGGTDDDAVVFWLDLPAAGNSIEKMATPYRPDQLARAKQTLVDLADVGPASLPNRSESFAHGQILRRKDIVELFDTTPDLAGYDVDISVFVREMRDLDVQVFWRDLTAEVPQPDESAPHRDELCSVPIADVRKLLINGLDAWTWDYLEAQWSRLSSSSAIYPGLTLMLRAANGKYTSTGGWDPKSRVPVPEVRAARELPEAAYDDNEESRSVWLSLAEHTDHVVAKVKKIISDVGLNEPWSSNVTDAARWHDVGKAHTAFQAMLKADAIQKFAGRPAAKAPSNAWRRDPLPGHFTLGDGRRRHFRHELVSALVALAHGKEDLVVYLTACHHGKVRLSIRSLPDEYRPASSDMRFARGVWDGDVVQTVDLGDGLTVSRSTLSLSVMELGEDDSCGRSWLARMLELRDRPDLGPFRLAFLEALIRAADCRASGGEV